MFSKKNPADLKGGWAQEPNRHRYNTTIRRLWKQRHRSSHIFTAHMSRGVWTLLNGLTGPSRGMYAISGIYAFWWGSL